MDNKKLIAVRVVNIVLIVAVLILDVVRLSMPIEASAFDKINLVVAFVALAFGVAYLLGGYKKDSAIYFKGFMWLYVLSSLFSSITDIITQNVTEGAYFSTIFLTFVFFGSLILAFIQDLGKKVSFVIIGVIIAINLFLFIYALVTVVDDINIIAFHASSLVTSCTAATMIYAKYLDKSARGTD